jgi:mono/diheme cytochrome c family protein
MLQRAARAIVIIGLAAVAPATSAQTAEPARRTVWDGVYTTGQADRGQLTMGAKCAACHMVKDFAGEVFIKTWAGRPIRDLYDTIRLTMPVEAPGALTRDEYAAIVAAILRMNGAAAGKAALPSDAEGLKLIELTLKPNR